MTDPLTDDAGRYCDICGEPWAECTCPDITCQNCHGTGGEPYDDGCTPCEFCDGEGYQWWL